MSDQKAKQDLSEQDQFNVEINEIDLIELMAGPLAIRRC